MELETLILLAAVILISQIALEARRSPTETVSPRLRLLWGLLLAGFVGYVVLSFASFASLPAADAAQSTGPDLDGGALARGALAIGLAVLTALVDWLLLASPGFRRRLTGWLPASADAIEAAPGDRQWPRQVRGFDPARPIHAVALGLALLFFVQTFTDYIIAGGQADVLAGNLEESRLVMSALLTAILLLVISFVGSGAGSDRSWSATLHRLGLRRPTLAELTMGAGAAVALIAFQFCAGAVWLLVTPSDVFQQQTQLTQAIAGSVTSPLAALIVAISSSFGEEIAFRGALQPVLGLWPTTILFALTHIQYQFSPAALIILVVGLVFGLLRKHYGTSSAIAAHFLYNFTLLILAVIASQVSLP